MDHDSDFTVSLAREWQIDDGPHPDDDAWERFACDELESGERQEMLDHIVGCSECTEVAKALLDLTEEVRPIDPGVPHSPFSRQPEPQWWKRSGTLAGAASLAAAAALISIVVMIPRSPLPGPTEGSRTDVVRSGSLEVKSRIEPITPLGDVDATPVELMWSPVEGVRDYRLELFDSEAESIWIGSVGREPRVAWPSEIDANTGLFYWRVVAALDDGGELRSELFSFTVLRDAGAEVSAR